MEHQSTPQIFICYAHKDNESLDSSKRWLDRLLEQLESLQMTEQVDIWSDQRIELGEDWNTQIQTTLQQVSAAVLLVSPSFLASKYIRNSELPVLLKKSKDEGVIILPIVLRSCLWKETTFKYPDPNQGPEELSLASIQVPTTEPLNALPEHKQDEVLYRIAQRIYQIVTQKSSSEEQNLPVEPNLINQEIITLWTEKLTYFRREEAITSDPEKKFQLKKSIEECQQKIQELGG